jgi:hypothetical protein
MKWIHGNKGEHIYIDRLGTSLYLSPYGERYTVHDPDIQGKEGSSSLFLYDSSPSWLFSLLGYGFINLSRGKIGGSGFFDSHFIGFHFSLLVHSGIEGRRGGANALGERQLHHAILE